MPRRTIRGDGKKVPLNMRTTAELRKKIDKAAGRSGRSLVAEVEYRVEASFHYERYQHLHNEVVFTKIALDELKTLLLQLIATLDDGGPLNLSPEKRAELRAMIEVQHNG